MNKLWLAITLKSETCFARGDGVPGVVDVEVNHDRYGFPYLGGRTLKGLLHAEAAGIIAALQSASADKEYHWQKVSNDLLGVPGKWSGKPGKLTIGDAKMPTDLRQAVAANFDGHPHEILETLTTIRRQTAVDDQTGAPQAETLRSVRVVLPDYTFVARLGSTQGDFSKDELAFLAACSKAFHRVGSQKTRGFGLVTADLYQDEAQMMPLPDDHFRRFKEAIQ